MTEERLFFFVQNPEISNKVQNLLKAMIQFSSTIATKALIPDSGIFMSSSENTGIQTCTRGVYIAELKKELPVLSSVPP